MLATFGSLIIGGILIILGFVFNLARSNEWVRNVIEIIFLGNPGLFDKDKPYSGAVRWLGWESIVAGALIMLPTPKLVDLAAAVFLASVIIFAVRRFRNYVKEQKENTSVQEKSN